MTTDLAEKTIGEWVVENYRTAEVFKKHKIDFCCNGNRSIREACKDNEAQYARIQEELFAVLSGPSQSTIDYQSWPLDLLADYIEKKHHRYVAEKIPTLMQYLKKVASVHGERHPELFQIYELFSQSAAELSAHMKKEELILFPFIRKMMSTQKTSPSQFDSIQSPIQMMMQEHTNEGDRFREIARLSHNYTPPEDGCNTFRVTYALLNEFEEDLHLHIHLENNILFPGAIKMEKELSEKLGMM